MRKLVFFSLVLLPVFACTAILGDFTVNGGGGDGGGDSNPSDVITNPDAPSDGGDATVPKPLRCGDNATQRRQLTTGNAILSDRILVTTLSNGSLRVVVVDYAGYDGGSMNATLRSYTYDPHQGNSTPDVQNMPVQGQILDLQRYGGTSPGVVALGHNYGDNTITATELSNSSSTWSSPVQLAQPLTINQNIEGTIFAMDAPNKYYVAISGVSGSSQLIFAGEATQGDGGTALPTVATYALVSGRTPFSLIAPGTVVHGGQAYLMLNANGASGPPPVNTPTTMLAIPGSPVTVAPPQGLNVFPAGFTNAVDPNKVNAAFLVLDLFLTSPPAYYVGQLATSSLTAVDPTSSPKTVVTTSDGGMPTLEDIVVNANSTHWEVSNTVEQLLFANPALNPVSQTLSGGVNFGWWDATTGVLRAYMAGSGGKLIADVPIPSGADMTIGAVSGNIATLYLAYTNATTMPGGNTPPPCDIWVANIGCAP